MKSLGGGTCTLLLSRSFKRSYFILSFLIVQVLLAFPVFTKEMDCLQFQKLFGLSFAMHRINFSNKEIYSLYLNGLGTTFKQIDPKSEIFTAKETAEILGGVTGTTFSNCSDIIKIESIYNGRSQKDISLSDIYGMVMQNVLAGMDPHSNFFSKKKWKSIHSELEGKMEGIGIVYSIKNEEVVVQTVFKGGPAENMLLPGDTIVEINGHNTRGAKIEEIASYIQNSTNIISITVKREKETLSFDIEKREFKVSSVDSKFVESEKGIFYIKLSEFTRNASKDIADSLEEASRKAGIKGIILDLRYNPGGLVDEAKKIASIFLDSKTIAAVVTRDSQDKIAAEERPDYSETNAPIIIMINNFSASASELLSITLKDYQRALIVGTPSYGKGTGQSVFAPEELSLNLDDDFEVAMALTTFQFYSPMGNTPQKLGVAPDIVIKDPEIEKRIANARKEAAATGKAVHFRESEYANALPQNNIKPIIDTVEYPTNTMAKIVKSIGGETLMTLSASSSSELKKDVQLSQSIGLLEAYTDQCTSYHINSCHFTGGPYASR